MDKPYLSEESLYTLIDFHLNPDRKEYKAYFPLQFSSQPAVLNEIIFLDLLSRGFAFKLSFSLNNPVPLIKQNLLKNDRASIPTSTTGFYSGQNNRSNYLKGLEQDFSQAKNHLDKIIKNYSEGKRLLDNLEISNSITNYFHENLTVIATPTPKTASLLAKFLEEYIKDFENENLYLNNSHNTLTLSEHYKFFQSIIYQDSTRYGFKNVYLKPKIQGQNYRTMEFFLLMDKKGFIKIKNIQREAKADNWVHYSIFCNILKEHAEMESIYKNWIVFGNLSFRPDSGHAYNGELANKVFNQDHSGYKLLYAFIKKPEYKYSIDEIEKILGDDKSKLTKKTRLQSINDAVNKQIRTPLKMQNPKSRVNILGNDGSFWLSAIPNRS